MGEGWPARQAGTKLTVTVDGELYALDPSNSLDGAKIKVYDCEDDAWKVVAGDVPIRDFTASESPYLLASLLEKQDANHNIAVLLADLQNHLAPFPSASSSVDNALHEHAEPRAESERDLWKVVATWNVGSAELGSYQTLNI